MHEFAVPVTHVVSRKILKRLHVATRLTDNVLVKALRRGVFVLHLRDVLSTPDGSNQLLQVENSQLYLGFASSIEFRLSTPPPFFLCRFMVGKITFSYSQPLMQV